MSDQNATEDTHEPAPAALVFSRSRKQNLDGWRLGRRGRKRFTKQPDSSVSNIHATLGLDDISGPLRNRLLRCAIDRGWDRGEAAWTTYTGLRVLIGAAVTVLANMRATGDAGCPVVAPGCPRNAWLGP